MKPFTWPFTPGHKGVIFWCVKLFFFVTDRNVWPWKGSPLSVYRTSGIPWVAKICSNAGMVSFAAMLETISTSGHLEYASNTTRTVSPVGNGPRKSADTCYGPFGVGDIFRGSRWQLLGLAWQSMQLASFLSTLFSIPENHFLARRSCLVFTIPRCPS